MNIGDIVRIHKDYMQPNEDGTILYRVMSAPNANNRVDISPVVWEWAYVPKESVHVSMIYRAV